MRTRNIMIRLASVLLIMTLLSASMVTGRLARYVSSASDGDAARVAEFAFTQSGVYEEAFLVHVHPGDVTLHTLKVKNLSEVDMRCTVQLVNETNNLPGLNFYMTSTHGSDATYGVFDSATNTLTDDLEIGSGEATISIQTKWNNTDPANAEKVDYVKIIVTAVQID